jgi:subtilisin family serine protease
MRKPDLTGSNIVAEAIAESAGPINQPRTTGRHIIVFRQGALEEGINLLRSAGFKVVTTDDAPSGVINEDQAEDADVLVFTKIGTALVAGNAEQVLQLANAASESSSPILSMKPEQIRSALPINGYGVREQPSSQTGSKSSPQPWGRVNTLTGGPFSSTEPLIGLADATHLPDETQTTFGLQLTRVVDSPYSGRGVRVAVLDTGIDFSVVNAPNEPERIEYHPDFKGRTITTQSFVNGVASAKDGNGHGTHCVGTACGPLQPTNPPRYGIAYDAEIYVGKVLNDLGTGVDAWIHAGINWAIDNGCQVVSLSLGSEVEPGQSFNIDYEQVALRALDAGTLIVAAAGNSSFRPGLVRPVSAPANCPSVLAVAALDFQRQLADFSNGGINPNGGEVNLAAPGVSVHSSYLRPTLYARKSGTSMATPHVAGILALYAEANPGIRGRGLWDALKRNAQSLPLLPRDVGDGLVQAPLAPELAADQSGSPSSDETHDPIIITGGSATLDFEHLTFLADPQNPNRYFSSNHFIAGLKIRNDNNGQVFTCADVPANGQCTITVHCLFQGLDFPVTIRGRLIEILFDVREYPLDLLKPRVHSNMNRLITGVEVKDDNPGGTTHACQGVPDNGRCTIRVDVGHP